VPQAFKGSNLVTLLGVTAISTGIGALVYLSKNKNDGNGSSHSLDGGDNIATKSNSSNIEQTDVIISETLIIDDEPNLMILEVSDEKTTD
jgi:hypothetical protein